MLARILVVIALLFPVFVVSHAAFADIGSAVVAPDAGSASAPAAAPVALPAPPQLGDLGVAQKLWKNGAFFSLAILALYVGLTIASKIDKKHAFYIATAVGGVGLLVDSIRKGDTPNATSIMGMLYTTGGIMIAGPGHVKASG